MRFAATVEIASLGRTLVCHTKDISREGCFLDTSEPLEVGTALSVGVMDLDTGEVLQVRGRVVRASEQGVGIRLIEIPDQWETLVARASSAGDPSPATGQRLSVLVVGDPATRRSALALYVTSGWDVRFAEDAASAEMALGGIELDAVIVEREVSDPVCLGVLRETRVRQPGARRLVRTHMNEDTEIPSEVGELVDRVVESEHGLDALVDALTARLG